ncbi:hypothetical protein [Nocardia thailandica]|uniref:hypothetical protein n=1 Tax=Nocardia thailandica TaxID=257275 RepID=UPI000316D8A2|nr:hypothetical protein [Nocardia thailandica]
MPDRDIVDEIDELVDWQMSQYDNRSGYDHNVNQTTCPHPWCHADWHGLAITRRMQLMRRLGYVDPEYRYADDTSPVVCPGSTFDGEFTPPAQPSPGFDDGGVIPPAFEYPRSYTDNYLRPSPTNPWAPWTFRSLPADPLGLDEGPVAGEPRWWRCDDTTGLRANVVDLMQHELEALDSPARVGFWNHHWVLRTGRETIELYADRENPNPWKRGVEPGGRPWMEIYTATPPSAGVWRPMHGVLDMAGVAALQNLRCTVQVSGGTWLRSDIVALQLRAVLQRAARERFPGVVIHLSETAVSSGTPTPSEAMADRYPVTAQWVPKPVGGVMEGGHAHGRSVEVNVERVETVAPARFSPLDFQNPSPTVELNTVTYERAAYDTVTRRWVYRPQRPRLPIRPQDVTVRLWREDPQGEGWQELGTADATAIRFTSGDHTA